MLEVTREEHIYDFCLLMHSVALHFRTRISMKRKKTGEDKQSEPNDKE